MNNRIMSATSGTKKEIHIFMLHSFVNCKNDLINMLCLKAEDLFEYEFVWDCEHPDYLVVSEQIYLYKKTWNKFLEMRKKAKICVYFAGECICPDFNLFDYAISFDRFLQFGDRVCRIPTRVFFRECITKTENPFERKPKEAKELLKQKNKFCNFIYSNANGHPQREKIFNEVSKYKRVDSLGTFLNNTPNNEERSDSLASILSNSIELKRPFKFSIACENASSNGYSSEKIFTSLIANTIPIYWGNPYIDMDVNPKAFIDCKNFRSISDVIAEIKRIDNDDEAWIDMITEPWLTNEQQLREKEEKKNYISFLNNIFMQDISSAKRCGEGFHPQNYEKAILKEIL